IARHAYGLLARAEGRLDEAREHLARAAEGMLAMGALALAPPVLLDLVETALAAGQTAGAAEAAQAVEQLERAAKGIGRDLHRAAAAAMGPASLTARELEVARLAALRLTAAEIAHELFISRRTVEGHLANVYAKLGVHSKREFSQRAASLGLVDRPRRP